MHLSRQQLREALRQRYWLRLHVAAIALLTLGALWLCSALLMHAGVESLALRYGLASPVAYVVYLLLLRWWAGALARRESPFDGLDAPSVDLPGGGAGGSSSCDAPFGNGGGGDFAGGGADASWDVPGQALVDGGGDGLGSLADGAGSVLDGLGGLDEGAVVVVPLAVLVGIIALLGALLGAGVLMLFGVEVLLAVAVEVGLASLAGSLAYKGFMEGWLSSALRHTWRGAVAVLVLSVALGAVLDHWMPEARSLPHAARLIRG
ncbi:MAG TPA: hypothetical protein H9903_19455 [Candidatus Aquabacterium excrementipullorum]|nr:hypothetical protein [Candidatus Aquabacterium excrementipullorum]